jgi:hypothetical protein
MAMRGAGSGAFTDRLMGALRLNPRTYEDVENDPNATTQALLVVVLAAVATGIGATGDDSNFGLLGGIINALLGWIAFSIFAYFVGASLFATAGTSATIGQVLRTIGFAQAPKLLLVLGFIPLFGWIIGLVAWVWFVAAAVVALRQAFDFTTERAIGTAVVALIVQGLIGLVIALVFGLGAAVFGFVF